MERIELNINPYSVNSEQVVEALKTHVDNGLSSAEAETRLKEIGPNKIVEGKGKSVWTILLNQFKSPIVVLLIFAAGLSFYFTELLDGFAILVVILINTLIGFYMEFQAHRSMNALKKLASVPAKVIRDKKLIEIDAEKIVPGDVIFVEAGDLISADGRIVNVSQMQIDESALTGESIPVEKQIEKLADDTALADRTNTLFKGTYSAKGNGRMIVTATGMNTEVGKIASMLESADQAATPLEKKLEHFSKKLIWITLGLVVLIFVAGFLNGENFLDILKTSIALSVAAIPEGLPIVATMALAQGMMKMARQNVIVKKLSAVETLGGTNVICTDKTGTLTENRIEVKSIFTAAENNESDEIINRVLVLCSTAEIQHHNGEIKEIGDPLELGLLKFAIKNKVDIQKYRERFPKKKEEPFSPETKIMSTLHQTENNFTIYAKGASESVLDHCTTILEKDGEKELTNEKKEYWSDKAEELASSGLKVIATAYKLSAPNDGSMTENLVFVGLVGLLDPPRKEVPDAINECKASGINIIMITGDHPATAKNIALTLGIADSENYKAMLGKEMTGFENLSEDEKTNWTQTKVFARVNPKQKLDLVTVLQERKNIVAVTGDGINDAPALKKADIGIAMGMRGTQVSQEVADIILKDDSFKSIVIAIKQGRIIFENIQKFVVYLLSCNLSELLVIASTVVFNLHFQLFAIQILFLNLITDVLTALPLAIIDGGNEIMNKPPRDINEPIINNKRWMSIFFYAFVMAGTSIGAVYFSHFMLHNSELWNPELCNNILFFSLIFSQMFHVFNMTNNKSFFRSEVFLNKYVWGAIILSLLILISVYNLEPLRKVLLIYYMSVYDWMVTIGSSFIFLGIIQISKK